MFNQETLSDYLPEYETETPIEIRAYNPEEFKAWINQGL